MTAFLLICNPVDVWDFRAYFASGPATGYWCVTKTNFDAGQPGDRLYLRVTSRDKQPGIHGRFILKSRYKGPARTEHWRHGKAPVGAVEQFHFDVPSPALISPRISVSILRAHFDPESRLIRTPQNLSAAIHDDEADQLDRMLRIL